MGDLRVDPQSHTVERCGQPLALTSREHQLLMLLLHHRPEVVHPVGFVRLADHEFFQVLRNKLGWGLPHVAKPGAGASEAPL